MLKKPFPFVKFETTYSGGNWLVGGMRELFHVMEIFCILIGVLVTQGTFLLNLSNYQISAFHCVNVTYSF